MCFMLSYDTSQGQEGKLPDSKKATRNIALTYQFPTFPSK